MQHFQFFHIYMRCLIVVLKRCAEWLRNKFYNLNEAIVKNRLRPMMSTWCLL